MSAKNHFSAARSLEVGGKSYRYYSLDALQENGHGDLSRLPFSIKVLLEAAIRQFDGRAITEEHVKQLTGWADGRDNNKEIPFIPARIVLQDFTGVPVVVDLAAMRDTVKKQAAIQNRSTRSYLSISLSTTPLWLMLLVPTMHLITISKLSLSVMKSVTASCVGHKRRSTTSVQFHHPQGSFTRLTWSIWLPWQQQKPLTAKLLFSRIPS